MAIYSHSQRASQGTFTTIAGTRIYSEVEGSGPPLVLVHGLGGSTRWWERNRAFLARHFTVYLLDLAGCGRSSGRFVLAEAAEHLAEWLRMRSLSRVNLIGHSLGGYIAACLAARHPRLINKLVLVGAALNCPDIPRENTRITRLPVPFSMIPVVLEDMARAGVFDMARIAYELTRADIRETLEQIHARTLLLWGERDSAVPLNVARTAQEYLPAAKLAVICDAGHAPMWEQPLAFNQTVLSFLNDRPIRAVLQ